jgi:hypothetical protein
VWWFGPGLELDDQGYAMLVKAYSETDQYDRALAVLEVSDPTGRFFRA